MCAPIPAAFSLSTALRTRTFSYNTSNVERPVPSTDMRVRLWRPDTEGRKVHSSSRRLARSFNFMSRSFAAEYRRSKAPASAPNSSVVARLAVLRRELMRGWNVHSESMYVISSRRRRCTGKSAQAARAPTVMHTSRATGWGTRESVSRQTREAATYDVIERLLVQTNAGAACFVQRVIALLAHVLHALTLLTLHLTCT